MKKINIKKVLLAVLIILSIGTLLFIGLFVWAMVTDKSPQFFPLNNSRARYSIVKSSIIMGARDWDEKEATNSSKLPEPRYYVEYRGENVFADDRNNNFFRVTVGNSRVELEPFVGKDVMITKGRFVSSSKQCIVNRCIYIYGPLVVLNIDGLELAK